MSEKIVNFAQYKENSEQTEQEKFVEAVESMLKHSPYAERIQSIDWAYKQANGKTVTTITLTFAEDESGIVIMDTVDGARDFIQFYLEPDPNYADMKFSKLYAEGNKGQLIFTR